MWYLNLCTFEAANQSAVSYLDKLLLKEVEEPYLDLTKLGYLV